MRTYYACMKSGYYRRKAIGYPANAHILESFSIRGTPLADRLGQLRRSDLGFHKSTEIVHAFTWHFITERLPCKPCINITKHC
jgi:hypothetical protein